MAETWLYTILSVVGISLLSFIGILTISIKIEKLKKVILFLVSFSAGSLLGGAFIHLLPEVYSESANTEIIPFMILAGLLVFFILEKLLFWRHCHVPTSQEHPHPLGINNLVGDGLHNFVDGVIIAGSYLVSVPVGIATTIAVILHEIPQEIGDFGVLIHAGYSKRKALLFNFLSALTAVLGAVLTLAIGVKIEQVVVYLIPITIGGFIYIATADLIPELKKETNLGKSLLQLVFLLLGMSIMALLLLIE